MTRSKFNMRLMALASAASFSACTASSAAYTSAVVSDLAFVMKHPLESDGKTFDGYVYLYEGTFYFFYPKPTVTRAEFESYDVSIVPGVGGQELFDMKNLATGQRLHIRGRLETSRSCFIEGAGCFPLTHPIFVNDLEVVGK